MPSSTIHVNKNPAHSRDSLPLNWPFLSFKQRRHKVLVPPVVYSLPFPLTVAQLTCRYVCKLTLDNCRCCCGLWLRAPPSCSTHKYKKDFTAGGNCQDSSTAAFLKLAMRRVPFRIETILQTFYACIQYRQVDQSVWRQNKCTASEFGNKSTCKCKMYYEK
jgi:hypothetical protein